MISSTSAPLLHFCHSPGLPECGSEETHLCRAAILNAYCQNQRALIDSAEAMMGCRALAEDVVQDAFLKLWQQGDALRVDDSGRYLFRVVRNLGIDRLRRLALEQRHSAPGALVDMEPAPPSSSPEQCVLGADSLYQVLAALAELPKRMQRVLTLHRIEGMTQRAVAEDLGVSPALVNFMLRDTLAHCRSRLA